MMFDIQIVNLDAGSYLRMMQEKGPANTEKENKNLYLQDYMERRSNFTPMVYSADVIPIVEALAKQKRLTALLSYKLKQEYSEICGFVRARISLAILMSNILILFSPHYKGARIRKRPELRDGAVMALIAPWRG